MGSRHIETGASLLHRYRIERELGRGALGSAFLAYDEVWNRSIVLKVLRSSSPATERILRREFQLLRGVIHPHLVQVWNLHRFRLPTGEPSSFYTSTFVDGTSLEAWALNKPWENVRRPIIDALSALAFLHELGIRHGDFKPSNVLVDAHGRGTLIDLSCARPIGETWSGDGTPGFIAPELLEGKPGDARSDLFSVGQILQLLSRRGVSLPEHVSDLVSRLIRPAIVERPLDTQQVLEALGEHQSGFTYPIHSVSVLGRDEELAQFERFFRDFLSNKDAPRVFRIQGLPGSGRTRLLQECRFHAELDCDVVEGTPRQTVDALVRRAVGVETGVGLSDLLRAIHTLVARPTPTLLCVDDTHRWAAEDRVLFDALLRSIEPRGRLALMYSAADPPDDMPTSGVQVKLHPLDSAAVATWCGSVIAADQIPEVMQVTGGVPGKVAALLAAVASGYTSVKELQRYAARDSTYLAERLMHMDGAARHSLGCIAALGGEVFSSDSTELGLARDALGRLLRVGWLHLADDTYRLSADLEPEDVLRQLPVEDRVGAAEHVLDWLDRTSFNASDSAEQSVRCARRAWLLAALGREQQAWEAAECMAASWSRAPLVWQSTARVLERHVRCVEHWLLLAELHTEGGAPNEALRCLARGLRLRPKAALRARIDGLAGQAYLRLGAVRNALRRLRRADENEAVPERRFRITECLSIALIKQGQYAEAEQRLTLLLGSSEEAAKRPMLHHGLGLVYGYQGRVEEARAALAHAARLLEIDGSEREKLRVRSAMGLVEYRAAHLEAASVAYREAQTIARHSAINDQLAVTTLNVAVVAHQLGDLGSALEGYQDAARQARALGIESTELTARSNLARLYLDIGAWDRARDEGYLLVERIGQAGLPFLRAVALSVLGEALAHLGEMDRGLLLLDEARAIFEKENAHRECLETILSTWDLDSTKTTLSAKEHDKIDELLTLVDAADLHVRWHMQQGVCALRANQIDKAVDLLETALKKARTLGHRLLLAQVLSYVSRAYERRAIPTLARQTANEARGLWERAVTALPGAYQDAFWRHPNRIEMFKFVETPLLGPAEESEQLRKLRRLLHINQLLNSSLDQMEVLGRTIDAAIELTGAERGFVLIADEERWDDRPPTNVQVAVARNVDREALGKGHLKFSRGIAEQVIHSGELLVTTDALSDERLHENESVHAMRLRSVICVPIRTPRGLRGAVYLDNRFRAGLFQDDAIELLSELGHQVALALTNADLYAELSRKNAVLEEQQQHIEELAQLQSRQIGELQERLETHREATVLRHDYSAIKGRSGVMQNLLATVDRVVDNDVPVLIRGESGTGKELVARALHFQGPREGRPFVAINCGALPESLLEAELFGYARGAFTGAHRDTKGLIASAAGGTLFLDEIGEMPLTMQVKLLRVLQDHRVRPLGANTTDTVDFRLVCATHRDLRAEIAAGRFREDFYYRIALLEVRVPPLRERLEDLPELIHFFLERGAAQLGGGALKLTPQAYAKLRSYSWPGNIRQLENVLVRAQLLSRGDSITAGDVELPDAFQKGLPRNRRKQAALEPKRIREALQQTDGNATEAARLLGISRATLYRRFEQYRIRYKS